MNVCPISTWFYLFYVPNALVIFTNMLYYCQIVSVVSNDKVLKVTKSQNGFSIASLLLCTSVWLNFLLRSHWSPLWIHPCNSRIVKGLKKIEKLLNTVKKKLFSNLVIRNRASINYPDSNFLSVYASFFRPLGPWGENSEMRIILVKSASLQKCKTIKTSRAPVNISWDYFCCQKGM